MSDSQLVELETAAADAQGTPAATAVDRALAEEVAEYFETGATVDPGDVVVDVGANVGAFARCVAERTSGRVTVHCFEPAPATFAELERTLAGHRWLSRARTSAHRVALTSNELAGRARPFYYFARIPTNSTYDLADKHAEYQAFFLGKAAALATSLGRVPLVGRVLGRLVTAVAALLFHPRNRPMVWLANRLTGLETTTCQTDSLERWAAAHGVAAIDLLKIDVEGAELDVLRGVGSLWPNVRSVAIEAHDRDGRVDAITKLLSEHGLSSIRRRVPRVAEQTGLDNVLLVAHREPASTERRLEAAPS